MSETGRCGCGIWMWSNVGGGMWTDAVGREKVRMEYCWQCGHQLLAEGRTQAPATEEERADARRFRALANAGDAIEVWYPGSGLDLLVNASNYEGDFDNYTFADAVDAYIAANPQN